MNTGSRPRRVHIETFGCQMNEYDTELIRSLMKAEGFEFTNDRERADVMLMNTCAIRENAHNRVYGHLAELKSLKKQRPLVVGVLGCMAQNLKHQLTEKEPLVDVLAGPDSYRQLPALIARALASVEHGPAGKGLAVDRPNMKLTTTFFRNGKTGSMHGLPLCGGATTFAASAWCPILAAGSVPGTRMAFFGKLKRRLPAGSAKLLYWVRTSIRISSATGISHGSSPPWQT
jgi:hypothetical protein